MKNGLQFRPAEKLIIGLATLFCLFLFGTAGFVILEKMKLLEGAYMTVITLSTVGFGEVAPLHPAGRIFVIFLIYREWSQRRSPDLPSANLYLRVN